MTMGESLGENNDEDPVADVVVFGGGITGLTVAHELAERNFFVTVVDPDYREHKETREVSRENPGLGGVARSQWAFVYNKARERAVAERPDNPRHMNKVFRFPEGAEPLQMSCEFVDGKVTFNQPVDPGTKNARGSLPEVLTPFAKAFGDSEDEDEDESGNGSAELECFAAVDTDAKAMAVLKKLKELLLERASTLPWKQRARAEKIIGRIEVNPPGDGDPLPSGALRIRLNVMVMPGEHGFRFFPSFYRHIFDLMRRIPATNFERERRGRDTVFDNLVPVETVGYVGKDAGGSARVARRAIRSMEEVHRMLEDMWRETGYTGADLTRIALKTWKYMTSSRQRRERDYEDISWFEFSDGEGLSERGKFLAETTPGALVGLLGSASDARTQGTILMQFLQDQTGDGRRSDMLLNGPTDQAWFAPWYRYLKTQEVKFIQGSLDGFRYDPESKRIEPLVNRVGASPRPVRFKLPSPPRRGVDPRQKKNPRVYYVIALPLLEALRVSEKFFEVFDAHLTGERRPRDLQRLRDFHKGGSASLEEALTQPEPTGPLRHVSGIQYFFNQDLRLFSSHTQYLDIPAGVTAVAQPQFWLDPRTARSGYRSVLSIDIGIWAPPKRNGKVILGASPAKDYPWSWTREEMAVGLWTAIHDQHSGDFPLKDYPSKPEFGRDWPRLPWPVYYHIDDYLEFHPETDKLIKNNSPYLVCETGRFRSRPGGFAAKAPTWKVEIDYEVALDQFILAGTYMQTYTRLSSMEAACESARHAVNALLRDRNSAGEPCDIWDPEDYENPDIDRFKEIDDRLRSRDMPHMSEVMGAHDFDAWVWPSGGWAEAVQALRNRHKR